MALDIKPNLHEAVLFKDIIYLKKGNKIIETAKLLPITSKKEYDTYEKRANKEFIDALYYLEGAARLKPNDITTLEALKSTYYFLKKKLRI